MTRFTCTAPALIAIAALTLLAACTPPTEADTRFLETYHSRVPAR